MNLAIFDVDGTLTDTKVVDEVCYGRAMADEFGFGEVTGETAAYVTSTDSGIMGEIFEERLGRAPTAEEIVRVQDRFIGYMAEQVQTEPQAFAQIPGAAGVLEWLRQDDGWAVAIATGCWEASARFKLRTAGIDVRDIPAAFANHLPHRHDIIREAIRLAGDRGAFDEIVYVGDAPWDVRAASHLKIGFVGIAADEPRASTLRAAGATHIVPDYAELDAFLDCLAAADLPS